MAAGARFRVWIGEDGALVSRQSAVVAGNLGARVRSESHWAHRTSGSHWVRRTCLAADWYLPHSAPGFSNNALRRFSEFTAMRDNIDCRIRGSTLAGVMRIVRALQKELYDQRSSQYRARINSCEDPTD